MIDTKKVAENIRKHLTSSGWADILRMFLIDEQMTRIIEQVMEKKRLHGAFVPTLKDSLNWMIKCPVYNMKVIIVTDETDNLLGASEGIPMSRKEYHNSYILNYLFQSIDPVYYSGTKDLTRWCKQGVLLMPLTLTWNDGGKGHHSIWKPFTMYLMNKLSAEYNHIPVIFLGNRTLWYTRVLQNKNRFYLNGRIRGKSLVWDQVNDIIRENGQVPVKW
jgi:uracil DNA glycosylase